MKKEKGEKGREKKKIIFVVSIIFLLIGFFALHYALTKPCEISKIKAKIEGQIGKEAEKIKFVQNVSLNVTLELPKQAERILCFADLKILLALIVGISTIFCGIAGIFSSLKK